MENKKARISETEPNQKIDRASQSLDNLGEARLREMSETDESMKKGVK